MTTWPHRIAVTTTFNVWTANGSSFSSRILCFESARPGIATIESWSGSSRHHRAGHCRFKLRSASWTFLGRYEAALSTAHAHLCGIRCGAAITNFLSFPGAIHGTLGSPSSITGRRSRPHGGAALGGSGGIPAQLTDRQVHELRTPMLLMFGAQTAQLIGIKASSSTTSRGARGVRTSLCCVSGRGSRSPEEESDRLPQRIFSGSDTGSRRAGREVDARRTDVARAEGGARTSEVAALTSAALKATNWDQPYGPNSWRNAHSAGPARDHCIELGSSHPLTAYRDSIDRCRIADVAERIRR